MLKTAVMAYEPITWRARAPRSGVPAAVGCEWLDLLEAQVLPFAFVFLGVPQNQCASKMVPQKKPDRDQVKLSFTTEPGAHSNHIESLEK